MMVQVGPLCIAGATYCVSRSRTPSSRAQLGLRTFVPCIATIGILRVSYPLRREPKNRTVGKLRRTPGVGGADEPMVAVEKKIAPRIVTVGSVDEVHENLLFIAASVRQEFVHHAAVAGAALPSRPVQRPGSTDHDVAHGIIAVGTTSENPEHAFGVTRPRRRQLVNRSTPIAVGAAASTA